MDFPVGLLLDVMLVLLLVATLGYCLLLSRKLDRFRDGQSELRQVVGELASATVSAERAIKGLKATSDETDARLSDKLRRARALIEELTLLSAAGARLNGRQDGGVASRRNDVASAEYRRAG